MNKDGINNSTESPGRSSQEIDHLRLQSCAASGKGRKRHSYSMSTKLEAIAYAENNSKEAAARKNFVWMQEESENGAKRKQSSRLQHKQTKGKDYTAVGESLFQLSLRKECSSGSTI